MTDNYTCDQRLAFSPITCSGGRRVFEVAGGELTNLSDQWYDGTANVVSAEHGCADMKRSQPLRPARPRHGSAHGPARPGCGGGVQGIRRGELRSWRRRDVLRVLLHVAAVDGELVLPVVVLPHRIPLAGAALQTAPAIAITLVYAACLGGALYLAIFRWLRHAPALAKVVASIGLMLTLQALAVLHFGTQAQPTPAVLPSEPIDILGASVGRDRVYLAGIAVVAAVVLAAVYRFTRFGIVTVRSPRTSGRLRSSAGGRSAPKPPTG